MPNVLLVGDEPGCTALRRVLEAAGIWAEMAVPDQAALRARAAHHDYIVVVGAPANAWEILAAAEAAGSIVVWAGRGREEQVTAMLCAAQAARGGIPAGEAARALEIRDDVLSVVSHDLRNPLNAIGIAADSLAHVDVTPAQRERYGSAIRRGVDRANRLISDLMDANRLAAGQLTVEPVRQTVAGFLEQAAAEVAETVSKRSVTLLVHADADVGRVMVDRHRMVQALRHLIEGTLRFTDRGGRIELGAGKQGGVVRVTIFGTGVGVPAEKLPHLFASYWELRRQRSGMGPGLYIARGIIEAHGSRVTASSEADVGTTFTFELAGVEE